MAVLCVVIVAFTTGKGGKAAAALAVGFQSPHAADSDSLVVEVVEGATGEMRAEEVVVFLEVVVDSQSAHATEESELVFGRTGEAAIDGVVVVLLDQSCHSWLEDETVVERTGARTAEAVVVLVVVFQSAHMSCDVIELVVDGSVGAAEMVEDVVVSQSPHTCSVVDDVDLGTAALETFELVVSQSFHPCCFVVVADARGEALAVLVGQPVTDGAQEVTVTSVVTTMV